MDSDFFQIFFFASLSSFVLWVYNTLFRESGDVPKVNVKSLKYKRQMSLKFNVSSNEIWWRWQSFV